MSEMWNELTKGIIKENPLFVQVLGLCPSLAVTTSAMNAIGMSVAFTLVLIFSNFIISSIRKFVADSIRIPVYIIVIASLVTIIEMLSQAYVPEVYTSLGIFLPLIVVNCIVLGRAEAFAGKNAPLRSIMDAIGMGLGFSMALIIVGSVREILGSGTILNIPLFGESFQPFLIAILPPGAFITMAFVFASINVLQKRKGKGVA